MSETQATIIGKQELVKRIAKQTDITQKQASEVFDATLAAIQEALTDGSEVRLVGFGSFSVRLSAARTGLNPRTRERMSIPAKPRVRFSPGKQLTESVQHD